MAFDVVTPVRLGGGAVDVSPDYLVVRTTPTLARDIVKSIDIANGAAQSVVVSVHLVPSGGAPSSDNVLVPGVTIPEKSIFQWTGTQVIYEGWTIQATASVAGVVIHVSGGESV